MTAAPGAIVLITADELFRGSLGCYGATGLSTPNIDALASRGVRYDRAYTVSPWCLPSRASMITGLLPHNSGAYSNFRDIRLDASLPNVYNQLSAAGYRTLHVGKCHYAAVPYGKSQPGVTHPNPELPHYYESLGIDDLVLQDDKNVSTWFWDDYSRELDDAGHLEAYRAEYWADNGMCSLFPGPVEWHPDAWVGRKAAERITDHAGDQPLFAFVSFSGPHWPHDPPESYLDRVDMSAVWDRHVQVGELDDPGRIHHRSYHGRGGIDGCWGAEDGACINYDDEYWQKMRHYYLATVALIDDQVGQILDAVDARFGDDALIVFTTDHGEMLGNHGLWGKNNCAYEEVWNIPLIAAGPGIESGAVEESIVTNLELFPTLLAAADAPVPTNDGDDLAELCAAGGRDHVVAEGEGFVAVTDGTVKWIRVRQPRDSGKHRFHDELLDRASDPHEFEDRYRDPRYAEKLAELQGVAVDLLMAHTLP